MTGAAHATYRANHTTIENLVAGAVRKYFPRADAATRDDLLQAGRMGAYLGIKRYDPSRGNALQSWLYTYVKAAVIDAVRQKYLVRQVHLVPLDPRALVTLAGSARTDGVYVARDQLRAMADKPDADLPVRCAVGESLTELGAERGLSKSRMSRILTACREALAS